jgi:cysteinyl-tRNA synthetase
VQDLLAQREVARNDKDFKTADLIRDQLKNAGLLIEDTEQGARWSIE